MCWCVVRSIKYLCLAIFVTVLDYEVTSSVFEYSISEYVLVILCKPLRGNSALLGYASAKVYLLEHLEDIRRVARPSCCFSSWCRSS